MAGTRRQAHDNGSGAARVPHLDWRAHGREVQLWQALHEPMGHTYTSSTEPWRAKRLADEGLGDERPPGLR